jgi:mandelate racemase
MNSSQPGKLKSATIRGVRVPMPTPHRTASGVITESPLVLLDLVGDDGSVGRSMVFTYTIAALKPTGDLLRNIAESLIGETMAPVDIERLLSQRFRLLGPQGLVGIAMSAIDMALWDALANRCQLSLAAMLGAAPKHVRAYGAIGYDGERDSALCAEDWAKRGFRGVKAKIGYPTVTEDLAVIRAIRHAVGDGVAIMVDYNQSLLPNEAIQRMRVLDSEGLNWVEEPTLAHDYCGHARIAAEIGTPVQCGENWWGVTDFQHAVDARASDLVMPDVMKIGGVTGWLRVAGIAQAMGLKVSNHLWPEISAQLLAATPTADWLEYADWWNPVLREPLRIEDGKARFEGVVGTGVAWDEAAVSRFAA